MNKFWNALEQRLPLKAFWKKHVLNYQVSNRLNVWYVFGLLALIVLFNQYLSGIWLAMFYIPHTDFAFSSVIHLMHDVPSGWFIRYLHTTGASMLFVVLYLHLFRGFLYGSYQKPRELVWVIGVLLLYMLFIQAFLGYVLPWGQMSYWGAEVATSTLNGLPLLGPILLQWLRGGLAIGLPLLQRFYALHVIVIPLFLLYIIKFHVVAIRFVGSTNPKSDTVVDKKIPFFPHHIAKESFYIAIFVTVFFAIVFFKPDFFGLFIEPFNAIPANALQTPESIHPPWYIAPYFVILRAVPDLSMGLLMTIFALSLWLFLPWLDKSSKRHLFEKSRLFKVMLGLFCLNYFILGCLAWCELNDITLALGRIAMFFYFVFFLAMPWYSRK